MIWFKQISSIATAAGKKLGHLFSARNYFSPSNLLTLYKAQIRPSLEYCLHILGAAAPTTLSILDAVQRRAFRLIGDPALTCHLQPLSHRCAVGDLSLFKLCTFVPRVSKAWNGLHCDVLDEPIQVSHQQTSLYLTFPQQPRYSGI
nr:unnamed protein product [Callosobruchus chinensis]